MKANLVIVTALLTILLSGCSTTKVAVQVKHPSEIDMSSYSQVALMGFEGNYGEELHGYLKSKLASSNEFKIIDCKPIKRAVETTETVTVESKVSKKLSDLEKGALILGALTGKDLGVTMTKPKTETREIKKIHYVSEDNPACDTDKLVNTAIISGSYTGKYSTKVEVTELYCTDKDDKKYPCSIYRRDSTVTTSGYIDIREAGTNQLISSKPFSETCKESMTLRHKAPPSREEHIRNKCSIKITSRFSKTVTPWTETVQVPYKTDGDVPELEQGINYVKLGNYNKAISKFDSAIIKAKNTSMKPDIIAKGYWNIGLAYQYSKKFDLAMASFDQGFTYDDDNKFIREKATTLKLKNNHLEFIARDKNTAINK